MRGWQRTLVLLLVARLDFRRAVLELSEPVLGNQQAARSVRTLESHRQTVDGENDKKQMKRLTGLVYLDDAMVSVEADRLSAALGHPEPQAGIAFTQLEVAYHTFYKDKAPGYDMFEAALSRNDLNGAKAANAIEQDAAQRFIDRLDAIDWPAQFEGQVNVLRDNLRKLIEFDRRQVDVATTAQIVPPEEGASLLPAVDDAVDSLQNGLNKLRVESNPELQC